MKLRTLFIFNSIVSFLFGSALVVVPKTLISLYGVTLTSGGAVIAQLFGSALIFVGLLCWLARNAESSEALQAIVLASFLESILGFVIALMAQVAGVFNILGWAAVGLYLCLAAGYGYFQLSRQPSGVSLKQE